MTFNKLLDIEPSLTLAEFIQLWLKGGDDKIYIDVLINNVEKFHMVRIIDTVLQPYYECKIQFFECASWDEQCDMTVSIKEMQEVEE